MKHCKSKSVAVTLMVLALAACGDRETPASPDDMSLSRDEKGHDHDHAKGHDDADAHHEKEGHQEDHEAGHSESPAEGDDHEDGHGDVLKLTAGAREAAGLVIAPVGPASLRDSVLLYGVVQPNAERVLSVTARFPGVVQSVNARIGDTVSKGQTLARVESNESLQVYSVTSPQVGVVTERFTNPGEQAETQALFTVADLSTVWVELSLYPRDRQRIKLGQSVRVQAAEGGLDQEGKIVFVSPLSSSATQSLTARVLLQNPEGRWAPGLFVKGEVTVSESTLALAVPVAAIQEVEGRTSVFLDDEDGLEPRPVKTGRSDGRVVEILSGLQTGEQVVGEGSFVLKAELGKGEAEHAH